MCLSIPGKIEKINGNLATVDFLGEKKQVDVSGVECSKGEYVLVTAGMATQLIPEKDAVKSIEQWKKLVC